MNTNIHMVKPPVYTFLGMGRGDVYDEKEIRMFCTSHEL